MAYTPLNRRRHQPQTRRPNNSQPQDDTTVGLSTSVNGNPNYDVQMDPSGWQGAANRAWNNTQGLEGSGQTQAVTQQVQGDQLMSNQLNSLIDSDSPLMERARQQAIDQASSRGLANSSIAAGNAMGAAMDRAMPIAQFDAGRFGSVADQNMAAQNQMAGQRLADQNRMQQMMLGHQLGGLDDFRRHALGTETREDDQAYRAGQADIDRMIQQGQFGAQHGLARDQFAHGSSLDWANHGLQNRNLNAQIYNSQFSPYFAAISSIYSNPNLKAENMNAAVENLGAMYPGFSHQAWQSIPPGLFGGNAMNAAMYMPRMPPMNFGGGGG